MEKYAAVQGWPFALVRAYAANTHQMAWGLTKTPKNSFWIDLGTLEEHTNQSRGLKPPGTFFQQFWETNENNFFSRQGKLLATVVKEHCL